MNIQTKLSILIPAKSIYCWGQELRLAALLDAEIVYDASGLTTIPTVKLTVMVPDSNPCLTNEKFVVTRCLGDIASFPSDRDKETYTELICDTLAVRALQIVEHKIKEQLNPPKEIESKPKLEKSINTEVYFCGNQLFFKSTGSPEEDRTLIKRFASFAVSYLHRE